MAPLYGKWRDKYTMEKARGFTYGSHMQEVLSACNLLFSLPMDCEGGVSFGERLFNVMDLGRFNVTLADFQNWSWLACLAHDLGKCSGEFQQMIHDRETHFEGLGGEAVFKSLKEKNKNTVQNTIQDKVSFRAAVKNYRPHVQSYRHEFLSGVLLQYHEKIHAWFLKEAGSVEGFNHVLVAAMGHHLKVTNKKAFKLLPSSKPIWLKAMGSLIGRFCKAPRAPFPDLVDMKTEEVLSSWVGDNSLCEKTYEQLLKDVAVKEDTPLSVALKWMVILSDSLGSIDKLNTKNAMNGETDADVRDFIRRFLVHLWEPVEVDFNKRMVDVIFRTEEERLRKGTAARAETRDREGNDLSEEEKEDLVMGSLRGFQRQALEARGKNLLATASTGGGKTISAMAWADPKRRLIFTTPTTDTATRLYLDYAYMKWQEDGSRQTVDAVKHSKEHLDFRKIATNMEEGDSSGGPSEEEDAFDAITTLQDFQKHGAHVTYTTADQVLGVLTFSRKSIMWLLQLVNSQVVFDEFHSYDPVLQAWHMRFLEWFPGIPTAHLSATVSDPLRQLLQKTGREFHEISDEASEEASNARMAPRYQIHVLKSKEEAEKYMGPGTLWFHNVVVRCQETGENFPKSLVYHSRFRFKDRRDIQTRMVDLFRADRHLNQGVACTQVAEMSLDVSADCAITEVCPPASLIQRMGRVNRREITPSRIAPVYVYMPEMQSGMPYYRGFDYYDEYAKWQKFASDLAEKGPISKQDLDEAYQAFSNRPENIILPREAFSSFVETKRKALRSGSPIAACIMRADYWEGMKAVDVQRVAVPVFLKEREGREKYHYHYIIDDAEGFYDPRLGFCVGAGAGSKAKEE